MEVESFAKAFDRFLRLAGRFAGMTPWFDNQIGLDSRYLRRWRNEGILPSVRDWNHFESKVSGEFRENPDVLSELTRLKNVWAYHHEQTAGTSPPSESDTHRRRARRRVIAPPKRNAPRN